MTGAFNNSRYKLKAVRANIIAAAMAVSSGAGLATRLVAERVVGSETLRSIGFCALRFAGNFSGAGAIAALLLTAAPLAGQVSFAWKDAGGGKMELQERGAPVLVYNYGPQWKQSAPEDKRRCCYIFPIYTPAGVSMLDDFPEDHWHHRGLFWAWHCSGNGR